MNQTEFNAGGTGLSQCDLVLAELRRTPGRWLPMPALAAACGGYAVHSRVSDLRKRGHQIEHRNERHGKTVHSFYRLATEVQG